MKKLALVVVTLVLGALLLSGCSSSSSSSSYSRNNNSGYSDHQLREDFAYFEGRWDAMTGR